MLITAKQGSAPGKILVLLYLSVAQRDLVVRDDLLDGFKVNAVRFTLLIRCSDLSIFQNRHGAFLEGFCRRQLVFPAVRGASLVASAVDLLDFFELVGILLVNVLERDRVERIVVNATELVQAALALIIPAHRLVVHIEIGSLLLLLPR